jgi:hypothetical protein
MTKKVKMKSARWWARIESETGEIISVTKTRFSDRDWNHATIGYIVPKTRCVQVEIRELHSQKKKR